MTGLVYQDFDLTIESSSSGPPHYRARSASLAAGEASAEFTLPFSEQELEILFLRLGRPRRGVRAIGSPEMQAAQTFGGRLFATVFTGQVQSALVSSLSLARQQGQGLRIRLRLSNAPELADLPWEFLYDPTPQNFLACSTITPLVRYLDLPNTIAPLTIQPPLKVLVMIANPRDYSYSTLNVEDEWLKVQAALADLLRRGLVQVTRLESATLSALQRQLRQDQYHIFHFIGHGGFDQPSQSGALLLEDEQGRSRIVSGHHLGALLRDHPSVRLALLNACEGARASRTDPFAGVAQHLVQQGIPAVIAMQFEITDQAAIALSHEFYNALADNYGVDAALSEARKALYAAGNDIEWGTPVLHLRAQRGELFDLPLQLSTPTEGTSLPIRQAEPLPVVKLETDTARLAAQLPASIKVEPQSPSPLDEESPLVTQSEVVQTIVTLPKEAELIKPMLSAWNPIHYFKLLWWIFIIPHQFQVYRISNGSIDRTYLRPVSRHLSSILTWLPLLLPSLAVWIEELPRPTDTWSTTAYGWLCLCLIGSIVLGGWLDKYDANTAFTMVGIVALVVALVISFVMAVVVVFVVSNVVFSVNTVFNVMLGMWSIAAVNVALGVAFGVAFGVAVVGGVVGSNIIKVYRAMLMWATGMAAITTGGVSGYLAGNVWIGVSLGVVGIITVIVAVIIAFSVVYIMNDSLKKGEASKLSYSCFVVLILAYSFLIWYCYFGGYQRFV